MIYLNKNDKKTKENWPHIMLLIRASHSLPAAECLLDDIGAAYTSFQIATTTPQPLKLPPTGHLIITSSAAANAIPTSGQYTIHCVHTSTAHHVQDHIQGTAHQLGIIGTNNAAALAEDILAALTPPQLFHHLTTTNANTHWYKNLTECGHAIQRHSAYATNYTDTLTPEAILALKQNQPLILCSQRSAEHLLFLAKQANISIMKSTAYCLSPAIHDVIALHIDKAYSAETPTFSSLIKTIQQNHSS